MSEENNSNNSVETNEVITGSKNAVELQNSKTSYTSYSSNDRKNEGNKKDPAIKIFIGIVAVAILIGAISIIAYAGIWGGGSKNKFTKLFTDDYLFGINTEMFKEMKKSNKVTAEISLNVDKVFKSIGKEKIGVSNITLRDSILKNKNDLTGKASILIEDTDIASIKFTKAGKLYGVAVPGLFDEYIGIKDEKLKELARKFDVDEDEIKQLPNSMSEYFDKNNGVYKEFEKPLKKYVNVITNALSKKIKEEKNVEIIVADESYKTKANTFKLTEKEFYEISLQVLKPLKNDKAMYKLLEKYNLTQKINVYSFEEWQNEIESSIDDIKSSLKEDNLDSEKAILLLTAYTLKGNTIAIRLDFEEVGSAVMLASKNEKNKSNTEISIISNADEKIIIRLETEKDGKVYNSKVALKVKTGSINENMDLLKIIVTTNEAKDVDKIEKISEKNVFLINDATVEEVEEKFEEISDSFGEYLEEVNNKLPKELRTIFNTSSGKLPTGVSNGSGSGISSKYDDYKYNSYDKDKDYNYNDYDNEKDDEYNKYNDYDNIKDDEDDKYNDYDNIKDDEDDKHNSYDDNYSNKYNQPGDFKIKGEQVEILDELKNMYDKVEVGITREEAIKILGKEDDSSTFGSMEFLYWNENAKKGKISLMIFNGKVDSKQLSASSSMYNNVILSKELGSSLKDLPEKISEIKSGMTLEEVENILGNAYFESKKSAYDIEYTWYDTSENYVKINFKAGKVTYVGSVLRASF